MAASLLDSRWAAAVAERHERALSLSRSDRLLVISAHTKAGQTTLSAPAYTLARRLVA